MSFAIKNIPSYVHFTMFLQLLLLFLLSSSLCHATEAQETTIQSWLNYQCDLDNRTAAYCDHASNGSSAVNLIYSKSTDHKINQTYHFFWSTIGNTPGFFVVQTNSSANLTVNWDKLRKNEKTSIIFSEPVVNTAGVLISKLFFWNLADDADVFSNKSETHPVDWKDFVWDQMRLKDNWKWDSERSSAVFSLVKNHKVFGGTLQIKLDLSAHLQRNAILPHLQIDEKSMNVQILVNNMTWNYVKTRLGVELVVFSTGDHMHLDRFVSFDDEYAPGVFQIVDLSYYKNISNKRMDPSYVSWKPVGYTTSQMSVSQTVGVQEYVNNKTLKEVPRENWPVYGFYSGLPFSEFRMHAFNVTIGLKDEPYYGSSNYTSWSFVAGIGDAPPETLSPVLKLIILIGFGLPLLALVVAVSFIIVLKAKRRREIRLIDAEDE